MSKKINESRYLTSFNDGSMSKPDKINKIEEIESKTPNNFCFNYKWFAQQSKMIIWLWLNCEENYAFYINRYLAK